MGIKERYAQAAFRVGAGAGSCGDSAFYDVREVERPSAHHENLIALAAPGPGEAVLELGSGDGLNALLCARRVGPDGKVYGLDIDATMLELARKNQEEAGIGNAEFLKGEIQEIPLPNESVDLIFSNCLISISTDKDRALREAFRVLRPGGRLAIIDLVVRGNVAAEIRREIELRLGCHSGALEEAEYFYKLAKAGFVSIEMEPIRVYSVDHLQELLASQDIDADAISQQVEGKFMAGSTRAQRPYPESRQ
jgi:arsenite methyltransferase